MPNIPWKKDDECMRIKYDQRLAAFSSNAHEVNDKTIELMAQGLGINFKEIDREQFKAGLEKELKKTSYTNISVAGQVVVEKLKQNPAHYKGTILHG